MKFSLLPINYLKKTIFTLILGSVTLFAQNLNPNQIQKIDSLKAQLKADSTHIFRFQKFRPYFNLDQRNSFIRNAPINVNGLQLGILIKERHVVGLGGYLITASTQQKVKTKTDKNIDANRVLDMKYLTLFYQYVAIDRRYVELDLQAEFGLGGFDMRFYDVTSNKLLFERKGGMLVSGIGPLLVLKPLRWIGITGMAGYRFTFEKNTALNFSGAYYSYGVWLDLRQIIRDSRYYLNKKRKFKKELHHVLNNP